MSFWWKKATSSVTEVLPGETSEFKRKMSSPTAAFTPVLIASLKPLLVSCWRNMTVLNEDFISSNLSSV